MEITAGMEEETGDNISEDYIPMLLKCMYRLIKSARIWYKEFVQTIGLKSGFKQNKNNTFLTTQRHNIGTAIIIIYVNCILQVSDYVATTKK